MNPAAIQILTANDPFPALLGDAATWRRSITAFQKLPELLKALRQLEKRLETLEGHGQPQSV